MSRGVTIVTLICDVHLSTGCVDFMNVEPLFGSLKVQREGHMLHLITRQEAIEAPQDVQGMIHGGTATHTEVWDETMAMLILEVHGQPFGRYFQLFITDLVDQVDAEVLEVLSAELGKSLADCVVGRKRVFKEHPDFVGSKYYDSVMVYGG
jgi:hypothetical protein